MSSTTWLGIIVGAWVLLSPWILGFSADAIILWSNVGAGLILVLGNVWLRYGQNGQDDKIASGFAVRRDEHSDR